MTKQVLNQLESLIKDFNVKNEKFSNEYVMEKPVQFKRGHYSVNVKYDMVFSTDMAKIMKFVQENHLILRLGFFTSTAEPYMDFQ